MPQNSSMQKNQILQAVVSHHQNYFGVQLPEVEVSVFSLVSHLPQHDHLVIDVLFEDEPCNSPALHTHVCGDMPLLVCMSPG